MTKIIKFEIVTPERIVLNEDIRQITVPTKQGEITVLAGHIPLVASLMPGVIEVVKASGEREIMSLAGGFIEVQASRVVILADAAERAEEIDLAAAEAAQERAEKTKAEMRHEDRGQYAEVSASIARELARTKAAKRWKKLKNIN